MCRASEADTISATISIYICRFTATHWDSRGALRAVIQSVSSTPILKLELHQDTSIFGSMLILETWIQKHSWAQDTHRCIHTCAYTHTFEVLSARQFGHMLHYFNMNEGVNEGQGKTLSR